MTFLISNQKIQYFRTSSAQKQIWIVLVKNVEIFTSQTVVAARQSRAYKKLFALNRSLGFMKI